MLGRDAFLLSTEKICRPSYIPARSGNRYRSRGKLTPCRTGGAVEYKTRPTGTHLCEPRIAPTLASGAYGVDARRWNPRVGHRQSPRNTDGESRNPGSLRRLLLTRQLRSAVGSTPTCATERLKNRSFSLRTATLPSGAQRVSTTTLRRASRSSRVVVWAVSSQPTGEACQAAKYASRSWTARSPQMLVQPKEL